MALTYTPAGALGSRGPDFELPRVDGGRFTRAEVGARPLVVMFICNHCPYVKAIESRILSLARAFAERVAFVAICSNDPTEHPEDAPAELLRRWREQDYGFPYLIDADQSVARAFGAVCTPDFFVYAADRRLSYRGRLDDSWRKPERVQRHELREALERMLNNQNVPAEFQNPSMGCSIKWLET